MQVPVIVNFRKYLFSHREKDQWYLNSTIQLWTVNNTWNYKNLVIKKHSFCFNLDFGAVECNLRRGK